MKRLSISAFFILFSIVILILFFSNIKNIENFFKFSYQKSTNFNVKKESICFLAPLSNYYQSIYDYVLGIVPFKPLQVYEEDNKYYIYFSFFNNIPRVKPNENFIRLSNIRVEEFNLTLPFYIKGISDKINLQLRECSKKVLDNLKYKYLEINNLKNVAYDIDPIECELNIELREDLDKLIELNSCFSIKEKLVENVPFYIIFYHNNYEISVKNLIETSIEYKLSKSIKTPGKLLVNILLFSPLSSKSIDEFISYKELENNFKGYVIVKILFKRVLNELFKIKKIKRVILYIYVPKSLIDNNILYIPFKDKEEVNDRISDINLNVKYYKYFIDLTENYANTITYMQKEDSSLNEIFYQFNLRFDLDKLENVEVPYFIIMGYVKINYQLEYYPNYCLCISKKTK